MGAWKGASLAFGVSFALIASLDSAPVASSQARPPQTRPAHADDPQRPTFRGGINFVRVDVSARAAGQPVTDLRAGDFVIREDGVAQTILMFEHVVIRSPTPVAERPDPRNVRESNEMAGDPRHRLFVLFLDTYHVTDPAAWHSARVRNPGSTSQARPPEPRIGPPAAIDRALQAFLRRTLGPDDLVALMMPDMEPRDLTFVRRPDSIEAFLKTAWARRFSFDDLTPEQEGYFGCYDPTDERFAGIAQEMVVREREATTLHALHELVRRLGELRDERKGVLLVSEGWVLHRPDSHLARPFKDVAPPPPPGTYVGGGGKLGFGTDPRLAAGAGDWTQCEAARNSLANLDDELGFRTLLDEANRANASFYPVDPRGLAALDTPIDYQPVNAPPDPARGDPTEVGRPTGVHDDLNRLRERLETLQTAAAATDGLALMNTNDLTASLTRMVEDLSDYYLIGYASTNARTDGAFRRIDVRVTRPGIDIRARRGYRAPTIDEVSARVAAEPPPDLDAAGRTRALASLDRSGLGRPLQAAAGFAWARTSDDEPATPVLWVVGEIDARTAATGPWKAGGRISVEIQTRDGKALASEEVSASSSARSFVRFFAAPVPDAGELLIRVRGEAGPSPALSDQLRVEGPSMTGGAEALPGTPVIYRHGPQTGAGFHPTADLRFRRTEQLRAVVGVASSGAAGTARLLDRTGRVLAVPVESTAGDEGGRPNLTVELNLAPLGRGDYLIEVSIPRGSGADRLLVPFRIIP